MQKSLREPLCQTSVKGSLSSSVCQFGGVDGVFITSACPETGGILTACLCRNFLAGLEKDRRADGQLGIFGAHFPFDLPRSCQVKRQLLEMEAESFVHWSTWDWTKASQVICHLLMGRPSGWRVGRGGGLLHVATRPLTVFSDCCRCIFSQNICCLRLICVASDCRKHVYLIHMLI